MTQVSIAVYRSGRRLGFTIDPTAFPPPPGWSFFRQIQCDLAPAPLGSDAERLMTGLSRDGFYIPESRASVVGSDSMRYKVRRFKSMTIALKELEPFVRNGKHLESGKEFANFDKARSRELWANWLVCAAYNFAAGEEAMEFTSDPTGGDGILLDSKTGETWPTEHVMARTPRGSDAPDAEAEILKAIVSKNNKGGAAYANGKTLIVFTNLVGGNQWWPNRVAKQLPNPLHFGSVWVVSLQGVIDGEYIYAVTNLDVSEGNAPAYIVRINADFTEWTVEQIQ